MFESLMMGVYCGLGECSRLKIYQTELPVCIPAWPIWIEMIELYDCIEGDNDISQTRPNN